MSKIIGVVLSIFALIFIVSATWYSQYSKPVDPQSNQIIDFEIKSKEGIAVIGSHLSQLHLIRSCTAFKITIMRLGLTKKIQAGFFSLSPRMNLVEIAQSLTKGNTKQARITIPEGLRREEIAQLIYKSLYARNQTTKFDPNLFVIKTATMEGQLFPDTYDFDLSADTELVINRLHNRFLQVVTDLNIPSSNLNKVTTLASLLERESASAAEMPEIAGVMENRLAAGWPLQIDATVQFALASSKCGNKLDCDWWPQNLTKNDLAVKSLYNTYLNPGLPSGPISNPGKSALASASAPLKTTNWFYLHDSKGIIHFAKTVEEHNKNVCNYLKKDCL